MTSSKPGPTPLLYSCIAYESTVLCEHAATTTAATSNLANIVLPKISHEQPEKRTYVHGSNHIHYISDAGPASSRAGNLSAPGLTYMVVATAELGRKIPFGYLLEIKQRFLKAHDASSNFASLPAYGAAAFNNELKQLMVEYGTSKAGQEDAFKNVQSQIDDVRGIMTQNIEAVMERGERIDLLVERSDQLGNSSHDFRYRSHELQRKMWFKNARMMILLVVVCICLLYLLLGAGCGFPAFGRCLG